MKPHQNIFFYYRGPRADREDGFNAQIENNTTKALINVLQYGGVDVRSAFLGLIDPALSSPKLFDLSQLKVKLQCRPLILSSATRRWLVTITQAVTDVADSGHPRSSSIPDALIYSLPHLGIIVESKLGAKLDEEQVKRHVEGAGWLENRRRDVTWSDIHQAFIRMKAQLRERSIDAFIVDQFCKYLEVMGLAPFDGFRQEDFDFFVNPDDDYRSTLRLRLKQFGEIVYAKLPSNVREKYNQPPYLGKVLTGDNAGGWVALRQPDDKRDPFRHCNLAISLDESCVSFNAVISEGKVSDAKKPIGVLHRRIQQNSGAFLSYMAGLGEGYSVRIFKRTGGVRLQEISQVYSQRLDSNCVVQNTTDMLLDIMKSIDYPEFHVRRELTRGKILRMTGENQAKEAEEAICRLYPVLRFLEQGSFD